MQGFFVHNIDFTAQKVFQVVHQPDTVKQARTPAHSNQHINITVFAVLAACDRAKHPNLFRSVPVGQLYNLITPIL